MTTPSRATSSRLRRRRRRSIGLRTFELGVVLAVGAVAVALLATKADELPSRGGNAGCTISQLAADRAAIAYLAGPGAGSWPTSFSTLTEATPPLLELPDGTHHLNAMAIAGPNWTLTMHGGGAAQPTFTCG